ncbi:MAG TPA: wax ester/triacylglycerol synthase domain-containing protein [Thermoleophilaceae bacterium]|nr:wax ester/triacylglycerol synthase domain-containing protein [Thermoleophilaceae bacterium]
MTRGESAEPLSADDAAILALEAGPVRGHTCKLILLDGVRGVDDLRHHMAERLHRERRLGLRLIDGDTPAWGPDPQLDIDRQVRDGGAVADARLAEAVGALMAERLPRDRPLWALDVVALEAERTALVWRIHHALADGMTTMRMARNVLFDDADDDVVGVAPGSATPGDGAGAAPASAARDRAAVETRSRLASLRPVLHVPAALRRELARRGAETALDAAIGERRAVAFVGAQLDDVKRIAHALPERATVNDVVLAAVAGGLRLWLDRLGAHPRALRAKVPVSLHEPGDDEGNRDSFICVDLPIDESDPVARLVAIAAETRERKVDRDADSVDAFFRDLSHVSSSLERFAEQWAMSPRVFTLNVSNVPGPRGPLSVLGAPVVSMHSLAEIAHRHALRVAVVSAAGKIGFGFCADADAIGSPQPIADGVAAELRALSVARG